MPVSLTDSMTKSPARLPGFQHVEQAALRAPFDAAWGVRVPPKRGLHLSGMFDAMERGELTALYVIGENPMQSEADRHRTERLLRSLEGVIAYSQRGAQEYLQAGIPAERIYVALNAAAHRPAQPPPEKSPGFGPRPVILYVGRLQARKRLDLLIQACAGLPEAMQPHLLIVGDGPARPELAVAAEKHYPATEFTGALFGDALAACFQRADLFVLPGTGGLAVQQAMAWGLPVIVAEGDGTQDDLVRPENGWRIVPGDLDDLSRTLQTALSDPVRLRRMGAASYQIVAQEVNLEAMTQVFIRAARQVACIGQTD